MSQNVSNNRIMYVIISILSVALVILCFTLGYVIAQYKGLSSTQTTTLKEDSVAVKAKQKPDKADSSSKSAENKETAGKLAFNGDDWGIVVYVPTSNSFRIYYEYEIDGTIEDGGGYFEKGYYSVEGRSFRDDMLCIHYGQDQACIKDRNLRKEIWQAKEGQGYVFAYPDINIVFKNSPSDNGKTIAKYLVDGPYDAYPCLGVSGDWYKVKYNNKIGYVKKSSVRWTCD